MLEALLKSACAVLVYLSPNVLFAVIYQQNPCCVVFIVSQMVLDAPICMTAGPCLDMHAWVSTPCYVCCRKATDVNSADQGNCAINASVRFINLYIH